MTTYRRDFKAMWLPKTGDRIMPIKQWVLAITVSTATFIISISGCGQKMLTRQQIIDIANDVVISRRLQLDEKNVYYDEGNVESTERIVSIRERNPDFAERFKVLEGRDYQTVLYTPKNERIIGGVFRVFVDRKTGEVITFYGEE